MFRNKRRKDFRPLYNGVKSKTVREFPCADSEDLSAGGLKRLTNFFKLLLQVHENTQRRLVKISLQDAVAAIERTIRANIENLIPAAKILSGSRTGFEKLTGKRDQAKGFFVQLELPRPVRSGFIFTFTHSEALETVHSSVGKGIFFSILLKDCRFDFKIH